MGSEPQTEAEEGDESKEYTVDVWVEQLYSTRVTASSRGEAEQLAEERIKMEYSPEKVLESRSL